MRIVKIVICMVICNAAFSQFVGTPYILKKIPDISLVGVTPIYADSLTPNPTNYSYILKGSIINYGTMPLLEYGFFYGKTFTSSIKIQATSMQQDTFSANLILTESSYDSSFPNYYIWAYAKNSAGLVVDSSSSSNFFQVVPTLRSTTTKKIWMDRNLGASQEALSTLDAKAKGFYYQWGRRTDGHQFYSSLTSSTLLTSPTAISNKFITTTISGNYDWLKPQNSNLWQGVNGINNPCPIGFRIPTKTEWEEEGTGLSDFKIVIGSWRQYDGTSNASYQNWTVFWASTASTASYSHAYRSGASGTGFSMNSFFRGYGFNVRCIKN